MNDGVSAGLIAKRCPRGRAFCSEYKSASRNGILRRGDVAGSGAGRGRGGRGELQGGGEKWGRGQYCPQRVVAVLLGSPRLMAFRTVPAIVSCLPDRGLRAGYSSRAADGEAEARRRGGGKGRGSPPRGALALPAASVPSEPCSLALSPAVRESGGAKPLLWHFCSVTSAQEADKSTRRRHSPVQNNFQFTRNNCQPQTTALSRRATRAGARGEGGRRAHRAAGRWAQAALSGTGEGKQEVVFLKWGLRRPLPRVVVEIRTFFWMDHRKAIHSTCSG